MATIKERKQQLDLERLIFTTNYSRNVYHPALAELIKECEAQGHVNLETKSREDGPDYFVCDNCGKTVNL